MTRAVFLLLAAAAAPGRVAAAEPVQVLAIGGTCAELVLAGAPHAHGCTGRLGYTLLDDGRTAFRFDGPGLSVAFNGSGLSETRDGRGTTTLPVDGLTLGGDGQPRTVPAAGRCAYGDPFRGPATVRCTATIDGSAYRATFVSDGQPPRRQAPAPAPKMLGPELPTPVASLQAAPGPVARPPRKRTQ